MPWVEAKGQSLPLEHPDQHELSHSIKIHQMLPPQLLHRLDLCIRKSVVLLSQGITEHGFDGNIETPINTSINDTKCTPGHVFLNMELRGLYSPSLL